MEIIGCRKARPTGRALAAELGCRYSEDGVRDASGLVIRYGNTRVPDTEHILNKREAIVTSSNKPRCKSLLMERGIPTPKRLTWHDDLQFPLLARPHHHQQGRGFHIVNNRQELARYDQNTHYLQEIVQKINEYRLFVLQDRIIEADLKEVPQDNPNVMVRNHTTGCFFRWVRVATLPLELKRAARDAIAACGLDFGAVDCATVRTPRGEGVTVFEVNSAPGLIPRKVSMLAEKLRVLESEL
jgi:glutathione synthase/RimK-type ligase-like ATP-grasp enzyme